MLLTVVLAAGGTAGMKYRNQARRFVAAAAAPSQPSTVRVNFNSDPGGASVVRADGVILGVTPLSTDVAFGDKPIEYVIRLAGYLPRTTSIVPNLPSPVFAVLQKDQPFPVARPEAPVPGPAIVEVPVIDSPAALKKSAIARSARSRASHHAAEPQREAEPDGDEPMQPSRPWSRDGGAQLRSPAR